MIRREKLLSAASTDLLNDFLLPQCVALTWCLRTTR